MMMMIMVNSIENDGIIILLINFRKYFLPIFSYENLYSVTRSKKGN